MNLQTFAEFSKLQIEKTTSTIYMSNKSTMFANPTRTRLITDGPTAGPTPDTLSTRYIVTLECLSVVIGDRSDPHISQIWRTNLPLFMLAQCNHLVHVRGTLLV